MRHKALTIFIGFILAAQVHAQIVTLGRTTYDKFLPAFWSQHTNADRMIDGVNANATLRLNSEVLGIIISNKFLADFTGTQFQVSTGAVVLAVSIPVTNIVVYGTNRAVAFAALDGERLALYSGTATPGDYTGLGTTNTGLIYSVPAALENGASYKWFAGSAQLAQLADGGILTARGMISQASVTASNAFYVNVRANNEAVACLSPIGYFGALRQGYQSNSVTLSLTVYTNVVSWDSRATNGFIASATTGYLTNIYAGWYEAAIDLSGVGAASQYIEGCVLTNDVDNEHIGFKKQYSNTQPRSAGEFASSIIYLPAYTGISFAIKSTNDTTALVIQKAHFTVKGL